MELLLTFINVVMVSCHVEGCSFHWELLAKVCVFVCVCEKEKEINTAKY